MGQGGAQSPVRGAVSRSRPSMVAFTRVPTLLCSPCFLHAFSALYLLLSRRGSRTGSSVVRCAALLLHCRWRGRRRRRSRLGGWLWACGRGPGARGSAGRLSGGEAPPAGVHTTPAMALDGEEEPLTGSARAAKPADRWPWVFVGVMLGLAAALIFTHGGSAAGMTAADAAAYDEFGVVSFPRSTEAACARLRDEHEAGLESQRRAITEEGEKLVKQIGVCACEPRNHFFLEINGNQ